jgi:hypothetical protein
VPYLEALIAPVEFAGALLIVGHCIAGLVELARSRDLAAARLLVIQGSLRGLGLKTAASLLKTIEIHSWEQIAAFTAIFALRTLVKRVMTWEEAHLQGPARPQERPRVPSPP